MAQIGELQLTMQDSEMAIESLKEASIIQPTDGHIHHQYGKALMAEKNYLGAVDALKRALKLLQQTERYGMILDWLIRKLVMKAQHLILYKERKHQA
ncbi:MAG: hypothetical protein CM1200mP6_00870 [Anaerolineaceae bacterium]|nr:MAG: hypothetical protein CM1200mP6_00870 [Anaerolineaceae bacterium]